MNSADRGAITNAIWLCGNCHKLVDDDPNRHPAGLLFEWQRAHENNISKRLGKASAEIRRNYEQRHLEEFGRISYLAERIVLEKGNLWEYRLTSEILRTELNPILQRWDALKRGLYVKPSLRISKEEFLHWCQLKMSEIQAICSAFDELINKEFSRAWGAPGVPGNDLEIVRTARLFSEMCQSVLNWEEAVRFIAVAEAHEELKNLLIGTAGRIVDEAAKFPKFISEILADNPTTGTYKLHLVIALPEDWNSKVDAALSKVRGSL